VALLEAAGKRGIRRGIGNAAATGESGRGGGDET
jgi:hypothetical protein